MRPESTEADHAGWRLLVHGASDGAANMAVDEALLDSYLGGRGKSQPPTLRLYGWRPAALSLGKSQPAGTSHDPAFLSAQGIDLVRRPTGGQAVLHEGERTYAVVGRLDRPPFDRGVLETYARIAEALRRAFESLGVRAGFAPRSEGRRNGPVCFNVASTHELLYEGRKIVGSAQVRRREAFLQHGSIPYHADAPRLAAAIGAEVDAEKFSALGKLLGRPPQDAEVDAALISGFEAAFGTRLVAARRTGWERQRAEQLRCWKYLSYAWTIEGRLGEVERAHAPAGLF